MDDVINLRKFISEGYLKEEAFHKLNEEIYVQNPLNPFPEKAIIEFKYNFYLRLRASNLGIIIRDVALILSFLFSVWKLFIK